MTNDFAEEEIGELRCSDSGSGGNEVNHFGISVDDYEYCIKTSSSSREKDDEVHADLLPSFWWDWDRLEQSGCVLSARFVLLAESTREDVIADILLHLRPEERAGEKVERFHDSNMTADGIVVSLMKKHHFDGVVGRNEQLISAEDQSVSDAVERFAGGGRGEQFETRWIGRVG